MNNFKASKSLAGSLKNILESLGTITELQVKLEEVPQGKRKYALDKMLSKQKKEKELLSIEDQKNSAQHPIATTSPDSKGTPSQLTREDR